MVAGVWRPGGGCGAPVLSSRGPPRGRGVLACRGGLWCSVPVCWRAGGRGFSSRRGLGFLFWASCRACVGVATGVWGLRGGVWGHSCVSVRVAWRAGEEVLGKHLMLAFPNGRLLGVAFLSCSCLGALGGLLCLVALSLGARWAGTAGGGGRCFCVDAGSSACLVLF